MERHFEKELRNLTSRLQRMSELVQQSLSCATESLVQRDPSIAQTTFLNERLVNSLELDIDHAVADCFALFQPVASDLRFLLAIMRINADVERIGDHCVNIAQSAVSYLKFAPQGGFHNLDEMATTTASVFAEAMQCFLKRDFELAQQVLASDDRIDAMNRETNRIVIELVKKNPEFIEAALELVRISRNLERIADLSCNIAEDAIFHSQAKVVKHHGPESEAGPEAGRLDL